jgi:T3SS negative regulator,GrlR
MVAGAGVETTMIQNGLYSLNATSRDGVAEDVGGVLILRNGQLHGGDAYVYYTGSYECSGGNWQGKITTSQEHTPTGRPMAARIQHIGFLGTYDDAGAKVDAMALHGGQSVRYDATLRLLVAD